MPMAPSFQAWTKEESQMVNRVLLFCQNVLGAVFQWFLHIQLTAIGVVFDIIARSRLYLLCYVRTILRASLPTFTTAPNLVMGRARILGVTSGDAAHHVKASCHTGFRSWAFRPVTRKARLNRRNGLLPTHSHVHISDSPKRVAVIFIKKTLKTWFLPIYDCVS